ncbi:hypothetical protein Poli38472_004292 [Pythium oligandrum]|uniref:Ribonuclease n=1 Tax=Pythium oligandrum TaxID=41045 RepID=A0A8K1FP43_PYTOL|nr:hypothetical protein Poli38472_004292 [Pythium oligandrum]|eukprot:TMW66527.1 hypothetical protein Poli38472_004292 [Pythium oligandrum]
MHRAMTAAVRTASRANAKSSMAKTAIAQAAAVAAVMAASGAVRRSPRFVQKRDQSSVSTPIDPTVSKESDERSLKQKTKKPRTARVPKVKTPKETGGSPDEDDSAISFKHGTLGRKYEETKIASDKYQYVVGCDEAGRGPLAGPVVAAACYVPLDVCIEGIHDSKKLTEPQREHLYEQLTTHPRVKYAVHVNSPQRIDEINILQASLEAMVKAVEALDVPADFVFVDGNRMPPTLQLPAETVIQGDSKVYSIAAASVIAKVTRDRIMVELDAKYPQYNLKQHKGYPTKEHMALIAKHGACEIHRMTFAPLKQKVEKPKSSTKRKKT